MSPIRRCPSWQTLGLFLSLYLGRALAGPVLEAKGLPEPIVPPKPKVNEPDWGSSTWKGGMSGTSSEPMSYIPASALTPDDDVNKPLFSNPEHDTELAENVLDLLNSLVPSAASAAASTSTSISPSAPVITSVTPTPAAELGCSIFSSYMSLCAPTPTSSSHLGSAAASRATDAAVASCACYSATYYVPDALDSAASACAGYTRMFTSAPSSALVPLATSAAQMEGFCASRNVRHYSSAQFGQVTPTTSSGSSSPSGSTNPSNDGGKLGTARVSLWVALFVSALMF